MKIIIWNRKGRDKVQALRKEAEYTVEDIYAVPVGIYEEFSITVQ